MKLHYTLQAALIMTVTANWAWAVAVTDPGGLDGIVNSGAHVLVEEVGNVSASQFNGLVTGSSYRTFQFTIEDGDGYGTSGTLTDVDLTRAVSGIDLQTDLEAVGAGFDRTVSTFTPTGGTQALAYAGTNTEAIFTFDTPVNGIGFTLNRFDTGAQVALFADAALTMQIGSTFSLTSNFGIGSQRSFFGYLGGQILGVRIINGGGSQFGIDDFTIVMVPEPGCAGLVGCGLIGLVFASRRRRSR